MRSPVRRAGVQLLRGEQPHRTVCHASDGLPPSASQSVVGTLLEVVQPVLLNALKPIDTSDCYSWKDVCYVDGSDDPKQRLDVYMPASGYPRPPMPVCLFVHGGGWQRGDKNYHFSAYGNVGVACARAGMLGIVANYRLQGSVVSSAVPGGVMDSVYDVARSVAWAHRNAHRFCGSADRIVLCGHSAGAHLAFLAACLPSVMSRYGDGAVIAGLVGMSGVYNIPRLARANAAARTLLVQPVFGSDLAAWQHMSPVTHASALSRTPVLLLNAARDFHLHDDAAEMAEALGSSCTRGVVPDTNHLSIVGVMAQHDDPVTPALREFVRSLS